MEAGLSEARSVIWRRVLDDQSDEHATFAPLPNGYRISAAVISLEGNAPLRIEYQIECDSDWRTAACAIVQQFQGVRRELFLYAQDGGWL